MKRDREEHCVTAEEWRPEAGEEKKKVGPKQHGGQLLKKKGSQLGGSNGRLSLATNKSGWKEKCRGLVWLMVWRDIGKGS